MDTFKGSPPPRCWMIDQSMEPRTFFVVSFLSLDQHRLLSEERLKRRSALSHLGDLFLSERGSGFYPRQTHAGVQDWQDEQARVDIDFGALSYRKDFRHHAKPCWMCWGWYARRCSAWGSGKWLRPADAYIPFGVKPWDVAAGMLLVEEAGGRVTSFKGEAVTPFISARIGIVSNKELHHTCVDILGVLA